MIQQVSTSAICHVTTPSLAISVSIHSVHMRWLLAVVVPVAEESADESADSDINPRSQWIKITHDNKSLYCNTVHPGMVSQTAPADGVKGDYDLASANLNLSNQDHLSDQAFADLYASSVKEHIAPPKWLCGHNAVNRWDKDNGQAVRALSAERPAWDAAPR
jgi:hypothetical protein